ncbi:MAG: F0F1 ATP synthase subunit A [Thermoguttaceae bacterium]
MSIQKPKWRHSTALLLFLTVVAGLCAGLLFAEAPETRLPSKPSSGGAISSNHVEKGSHSAASPEAKEHGLTQEAVDIAHVFGLPITNSIFVTWLTAIGLIAFAQLATRHMKLVPDGAQNVCEWLVETLYDFLQGIIGRHLVQRTFWFFASLFIFILAANWAGLIPGSDTVGWGHRTAEGFWIDQPIFRGATADLNMTLAMALVFFVCWTVWAFQELGPLGVLREVFAPKGETSGAMRVVMVIVFFAAGCLDIISILFRPISLSFRLYGNVFAGENMLQTMMKLVPSLGWLLPIPFYFLEVLVGLVQAMVFMLLTAVFTLLMSPQGEEESATAHK